VYWRVTQQDNKDENNNILATTRVAGTYRYDPARDHKITYPTSSGAADRIIAEDHFLTGGHISIAVARVAHKDNDMPVPPEVLNQLTIPNELKNLIAHWPFRLAYVGAPMPLPDPNVESHVSAMRQGVSQHLSRPFARPSVSTLSRRVVNGQEGFILSGGALNI
jgi:hypothetical protein